MWYNYTPIFGRFLILGIYFAFCYEFEYLISFAHLKKKKTFDLNPNFPLQFL